MGDYQDNSEAYDTLAENIAAPTAPLSSTSYFVTNTSLNTHYNDGYCAANNPSSSIVVLDYGQPVTATQQPIGNPYGTVLFDAHTTSTTTYAISNAVESFIYGYNDAYDRVPNPNVTCTINPGSATIAIGTSNLIQGGVGAVSPAHARAWANMVNDVRAFATPYSEVTVAAGFDAEPDYSNYSSAQAWVKTFTLSSTATLYNYGTVGAFPCTTASEHLPHGLSCAGWTVDQVYQLSSGITGTKALPEIYADTYPMDWYQVDRWGVQTYSKQMSFAGDMTGCPYASCDPQYNPTDGWQTLWLELNSDSATSQNPPWSTTIVCMTSDCSVHLTTYS